MVIDYYCPFVRRPRSWRQAHVVLTKEGNVGDLQETRSEETQRTQQTGTLVSDQCTVTGAEELNRPVDQGNLGAEDQTSEEATAKYDGHRHEI